MRILLFSLFSQLFIPCPAATILLHVGEQRFLRSDKPIFRFTLGQARLVRSVPHSNSKQLLLKGQHPGRTDIWVWVRNPDGSTHSEHHDLVISPASPASIPAELQTHLSRLEEVEIHEQPGGKVALVGEIQSIREARRLALLEHPLIVQHTFLSEALLRHAERALRTVIVSFDPAPRLKVETRSGLLWVTGSVERPERLPEILGRLKAAFPWFATEVTTLSSSSHLAYVRLMLLEIRKESMTQLGLHTPLSQTPVLRFSAGQALSPIDFQVLLSAAQTRGDARILSHPQMVLSVPGEAEFFSGGELPIRQDNQFHVQTSWKKFGLLFRIKALERTDLQLRLKLDTEISHLDSSVSTPSSDGAHPPGVRSHQMHTQVDATWEQPLFLSGLLQESQHKAVRGLPELADLPGIGSLFGSKDFQEARSELIAVLTVHQSPPSEPGARLSPLEPGGSLPPPIADIFRRSPAERLRLLTHPDYPWVVFR